MYLLTGQIFACFILHPKRIQTAAWKEERSSRMSHGWRTRKIDVFSHSFPSCKVADQCDVSFKSHWLTSIRLMLFQFLWKRDWWCSRWWKNSPTVRSKFCLSLYPKPMDHTLDSVACIRKAVLRVICNSSISCRWLWLEKMKMLTFSERGSEDPSIDELHLPQICQESSHLHDSAVVHAHTPASFCLSCCSLQSVETNRWLRGRTIDFTGCDAINSGKLAPTECSQRQVVQPVNPSMKSIGEDVAGHGRSANFPNSAFFLSVSEQCGYASCGCDVLCADNICENPTSEKLTDEKGQYGWYLLELIQTRQKESSRSVA